jgi:hypothetical protein
MKLPARVIYLTKSIIRKSCREIDCSNATENECTPNVVNISDPVVERVIHPLKNLTATPLISDIKFLTNNNVNFIKNKEQEMTATVNV